MTATTPPRPPTAPAAAVVRAQKDATKAATPPNPKKIVNFHIWKDAQGQARQIVGYTKTSLIYGKTDMVVLQKIQELLDDVISGAGVFPLVTNPANEAHEMVQDLLKRKLADGEAAKNYKIYKTTVKAAIKAATV